MDFKELIVYKKAFKLAMEVYEVSKTFPKEEKYSLIDHIRRSTKTVCAKLAEPYRKIYYEWIILNNAVLATATEH